MPLRHRMGMMDQSVIFEDGGSGMGWRKRAILDRVGQNKEVEDKEMTYEEFFAKVKEAFMDADASGMEEHLAYQFNITGEAEGIFYVEVKEGKLYVEPYEYYDRDAIFTASADLLMRIAEGKQDPMLAYTLKKLQVEGDLGKALNLKEILAAKKKAEKEKAKAEKADKKAKRK